jgi:hypothetical protein
MSERLTPLVKYNALRTLNSLYETLRTFVRSDPNGIQFSYNPFSTK